MNLIRTAEAMALALASPLDPTMKTLLLAHAERLAEYGPLEDLAEFLVIEAGDRLSDLEHTYGLRLVAGGRFTFTAEWITLHGHWYEVGWIMSDDGYGLVLLIEVAANTDPDLLQACVFAQET